MTVYRHWRHGATLLCLLVLLFGCASYEAPVEDRFPETPDSYLVERGDTLIAIAWRYGLNYRDIAKWNRLQSPDLIYAGQRLRLKPRSADSRSNDAPQQVVQRSVPQPSSKPESKRSSPSPTKTATLQSIHSNNKRRTIGSAQWYWPTRGQIVRSYKPDTPGHKGIQISGNLGQPIRAASAGQVVYSGSGLPGYGKLIILRHSDTLLSAYGYLGKILVREGEQVRSGQSIAELGTSNENRPVLHFEIRQNGNPVNPMRYLPS